MHPDFTAEGVTFYLGDCRALLADLDGASVDHTIMDPPYDERTHAKGTTSNGCGFRAHLPGRMDFAPLLDVPGLTADLLGVTRRWVLSFCPLESFGEWRDAAGSAWVRAGLWLKPDAAPQFTGDRPGQGAEGIAIMHRAGKKRWNGGGRHAVWTCGVERENRCHPCQKPLALMRQLILDFSDPGDLVADWYAGSGTTAVACIETGRRFIGCEVDEGYFGVAVKRIERALRQQAEQPALFAQPQRGRVAQPALL